MTRLTFRSRSLLRGGVILAAGGALAFGVAACGSDDTDTAAAAGQEGGVLRWAVNANQSWDPVTSAAGNEVRHLQLVYEALTHLNEQGDPTPGLAERWEYSADGKTLTFHLREGATFSDGTAVDAAAVKKSLDRAQNQTGSVLVQNLVTVKTTKVVDPKTVALQLTQKDYGLPLILGGKAGMIVSPKAIDAGVKQLPQKPVGAGPFKLTKFVPDGSATLTRNTTYWNAKDIHLDGVELKYLVDPQAILAGLQSGSIDLASSTGEQVKAAEQAGLVVQQGASLAATSIEVNDAMEPFDDPKVAQAVNYALDRDALIKTQNGGIGEVSYQPFPKGYIGYSDEVANLYPRDVAKAKSLLAEAGFPNGVTIPITYFDSGNYKAITEQIQAQLAEAGIKSKLQALPLAQASARVYVKHDVAFNPNGIVGRESPLQMLNVQYGREGLLNPGRKASDELTALLAKTATYPLDSAEYKASLQATTALAAKESAVVFLYTQPTVWLKTKEVSGLRDYVVAARLDGVRLAG